MDMGINANRPGFGGVNVASTAQQPVKSREGEEVATGGEVVSRPNSETPELPGPAENPDLAAKVSVNNVTGSPVATVGGTAEEIRSAIESAIKTSGKDCREILDVFKGIQDGVKAGTTDKVAVSVAVDSMDVTALLDKFLSTRSDLAGAAIDWRKGVTGTMRDVLLGTMEGDSHCRQFRISAGVVNGFNVDIIVRTDFSSVKVVTTSL